MLETIKSALSNRRTLTILGGTVLVGGVLMLLLRRPQVTEQQHTSLTQPSEAVVLAGIESQREAAAALAANNAASIAAEHATRVAMEQLANERILGLASIEGSNQLAALEANVNLTALNNQLHASNTAANVEITRLGNELQLGSKSIDAAYGTQIAATEASREIARIEADGAERVARLQADAAVNAAKASKQKSIGFKGFGLSW